MRVVLWFFAVIGFLVVLVFGLGIGAMLHYRPQPLVVAQNAVLTVDLDHPVNERTAGAYEQLTQPHAVNYPLLLTALDRATKDLRIKGLVVRLGDEHLGLAQSQEVRGAVLKFRAAGKFAYAFGESFGDLSGGTRPYYLASSFDDIWLQPTGSLALTGIAAEIPFFKGTLDKIGVTPQFERRGEFKTAATQFTETSLPDTDKAAMTDLINSLYGQLALGISQGRKLSTDDVRVLVDGGPYIAQDALDRHIVDHLGYRDEVDDAAKAKAGAGTQLISYAAYAKATDLDANAKVPSDGIAVIEAIGEIQSGEADSTPFSQGNLVAADTIVKAFHDAVADQHVKAIVFKINSPGGSEGASESIWRAVVQARKAGKPVIVSMSDLAASGGYYIAAAADKIVAEPMTETGSIGVFGGKFTVGGLAEKLGVTYQSVAVGKNSAIGSEFSNFTPDQRQRFAGMIDDAYKIFLKRVADGRHLEMAQVDLVARGRVWTGVQAKERGLVDELGGFEDAVRFAREAGHLPADGPLRIRVLPKTPSFLQSIMKGLSGGEEAASGLIAFSHQITGIETLLRQSGLTIGFQSNAMMRPVEIRD